MVTFEKLLKIIQDTAKTDYQKAADLHSLLVEGAARPVTRETTKPRGRPRKASAPNGELLPQVEPSQTPET